MRPSCKERADEFIMGPQSDSVGSDEEAEEEEGIVGEFINPNANASGDGNSTTSAVKMKKKKKKKKKNESSASHGQEKVGGGGFSGGDPVVASKVAPGRGVGGLTDYYVEYGQTEPPSIPVRVPCGIVVVIMSFSRV